MATNQQIADLFLAERVRQDLHGYDSAHDDDHRDGEIADAAAFLAATIAPAWTHPWAAKLRNKLGRRAQLVVAGALIMAEIQRLDRAAMTAAFAALLLLGHGCGSAGAAALDVAPVGSAVPVMVETTPEGAPCVHAITQGGTVIQEWDGEEYTVLRYNPACCPDGYSVVGTVGGFNGTAVVCLVLP